MKKLMTIFGMALTTVVLNAAMITPGAYEDGFFYGTGYSGLNGSGVTMTHQTGPAYPLFNGQPFTPAAGPGILQGAQAYISFDYPNSSTSPKTSYTIGDFYFNNPGDTISGWFAYDKTLGSQNPYVRVELGNWDHDLIGTFVQVPGQLVAMTSGQFDQPNWYQWVLTAPAEGWYSVKYTVSLIDYDPTPAFNYNNQGGIAYFDIAEVPEAKGWMMGGALLGVLGIGAWIRRRQQVKATA